MKKLLLIVVAVCSIISASAQKGTLSIYGNVGAGNENNAIDDNAISFNSNYETFRFNPGIGYQLSEKLIVGLRGGIGVTNRYDTPHWGDEKNVGQLNGGIFCHYLKPLGSIFFIYLHADVSYVYSEVYEDPYNAEVRTIRSKDINVRIYPAIGANIYRGWAIHLNAGGITYATNISSAYSRHNDPIPFYPQFGNVFTNLGERIQIGVSKNIRVHRNTTSEK